MENRRRTHLTPIILTGDFNHWPVIGQRRRRENLATCRLRRWFDEKGAPITGATPSFHRERRREKVVERHQCADRSCLKIFIRGNVIVLLGFTYFYTCYVFRYCSVWLRALIQDFGSWFGSSIIVGYFFLNSNGMLLWFSLENAVGAVGTPVKGRTGTSRRKQRNYVWVCFCRSWGSWAWPRDQKTAHHRGPEHDPVIKNCS